MIPQVAESVKEFIDIHRDDLKRPSVAKTLLFSEYVAYCQVHGYEHHTNLVHFCREIIRFACSVNSRSTASGRSLAIN